ncbi:MAG: hypothetical protein KJ871_17045 [Alphaproteobacteria bacterium]|uniref:hypothetical protein n=1 Tax=Hyphomonas sp. TaxID=87 RepID=UPI001E1730A9|nr:hypothetical protein [Alphaproteobacteria bacterium]MBU2083578.1 hypothetical protein [Alphaproteobacteria bacterium]MBU2143223.1 hypothetical protein [Alphaproteobacteria bacterium]MBU2197814.1 hypothetical protein [Alphaproteobacteria bacterium]
MTQSRLTREHVLGDLAADRVVADQCDQAAKRVGMADAGELEKLAVKIRAKL